MTTVLRADRLIDGSGAPAIDNAVLVLDGGKVIGVFEGRAPDGLVPDDAEVLNYQGCTIVPGLIDAHVHLNLPGDGTMLEDAIREPDGVLVASSAFAANRALNAGVTTVRDTGGRGSNTFELRRSIELGHGAGPRVLACGQPITITGGHTWYLGGEADGEDGLRWKVRNMVKLGADAIKVMASGGGTVNTQSWRTSFSRKELAAVADEGHRLGRKVTAHCLCAEAIEYAVEAGVDQLEHGWFIVDAGGRQQFVPSVAEKVAEAGVAITSTLSVMSYMVDTLLAKERLTPVEQETLDRCRQMLDDNVTHFARFREAGVQLVAGTDAGWLHTPFDGVVTEMELMHRGGMSTLEAIAAATGVSARVLGIEETVGTLRPGLAADVLVVGGDPSADLARLRDVRLVMQAGQARVQRQG